jgi:hypothetical protein
MPAPRRSDPDPQKLLDSLEPADRAVIDRWARTIGIEWYRIPPLLSVVETLAVLRLAAQLPDTHSAGDRLRAAAEAIGLEDDSARNTHPGDSIGRRLSRWHAAAGGHDVRSRNPNAA